MPMHSRGLQRLDFSEPIKKRVQIAGAGAVVAGIVTLGLAFPGMAAADVSSARSTTGCVTNAWTDTVTVAKTPSAAAGAATISGTGTALDGQSLAAGGGQQTVTFSEPLSVATVTVSGTMTWTTKHYTAPFSTTGTKPAACGGGRAAAAAAPAVDPRVTFCHRTNSNKNPYVVITTSAAGAFNGHFNQHKGPVWNPTLKDHKPRPIMWGDIIPPSVYNGTSFSQNWDAAGMAFFNNGCAIPVAPVDAFSFQNLPLILGGLAIVALIGFGLRTGTRRLRGLA